MLRHFSAHGFWLFSLVLSAAAAGRADQPATLPGTALLEGPDDRSGEMMDGLHRFIERKIAESPEQRAKYWHRDFSSREAYEKSIAPNRERFRKIIGLVDERVAPVRIETIRADHQPSAVGEIVNLGDILPVRWQAIEGVWAEGLVGGDGEKPKGYVVVLPDADQTPEQLFGLAPGVPAESQLARRLFEHGFCVLVPSLIDRTDEWSGNQEIAYTNQPHREWVYRQAYQMGRHVIGYEVQKVLAAVDWIVAKGTKPGSIGVAGYGEGGLLAFYAAAADPRIDACLVSGYFDQRLRTWEEPLYRNVWSLLREFGDAEIAALIAPRGLVVEHSVSPQVNGPPEVKPGRRKSAAVGGIAQPESPRVQAEFARFESLLPADLRKARLLTGPGGAVLPFFTQTAAQQLASFLACQDPLPLSNELPLSYSKAFDPRERQQRAVKQMEDHVQRLVRQSDRIRDKFFSVLVNPQPSQGSPQREQKTSPTNPTRERGPFDSALDQFTAKIPGGRKYLWEELLGKFDDPLLPPNPRSRQIYDRPKWTGYEVVLDVFPDVFAWGILLLPKDLKPGERRPVVVCQHGRNGVPRDTIEGDHKAYHDYAAKLADRGFIVFSPHNPYRGEDRYRFLCRKANSVKATLFSFILAQHEQILNYLEALPQVDPQRIAFYGLSYGGETAVRVPPLLERYCLSICSADFNDWTRKVASTDSPYSFMFTIEWEMPYFDLGTKFNYAEMASLMLPRPFMVERGHLDGVAPDEWVAYEYAKVRRLYDQVGLGDRTEIEFFNGPHTIHGVGTFEFLEKQLRGARRLKVEE